MLTRQDFIRAGAAALATALVVAPGLAVGETLDDIIAGAKKEGALIYYDGIGGGQGALNSFQKKYPFIKEVKYIRVPGAQKVSRFVQESLAGEAGTDLLMGSPVANQKLVDRDLALKVDWASLGVPKKLIGNDYQISVTTVVTVIVYNTNLVKGADIPRSWEGMLNPKFKGRVGKYARASELDSISSVWGEKKALEYARKFAALQPRLTSGTAVLNQAIGSGDLLAGFSAYDSALRLKRTGAPIDFHAPDPAVVSPLYAIVAKYGKHPNAAKLYLQWMSTPEGAKAFEASVLRGNALVEGTVANKIVGAGGAHHRPVDDLINKSDEIGAFQKKIEQILKGRG